MKQNSRNQCIIFALILLFLFGCSAEKDLINQENFENQNKIQQPNFIVRNLLGIEAVNIQKQMKDRMEHARLSNRGGNSEEIGTVLYDQILMVDNNLGDKTYIFRVNRLDADNGKFYNMILQQNEIGSFMLKLFKYEMTPDFAFKYNLGLKQMKDFQGNYSYRLLANTAVTIDADGGGGGGDGSGGGVGSGGGSRSGNFNDGNTGSPIGGSGYVIGSNNTSSGVGSLGYGNPCPQVGGGIGGVQAAAVVLEVLEAAVEVLVMVATAILAALVL